MGYKKDFQKLIKNAYRKLKSYAYFDKTQIFLKKRIIDFETSKNFDEDIEKRLSRLSERLLINIIYGKYENVFTEIECKFMPKKLKDQSVIVNNIVSNKPISSIVEIKDYQCFFDAPIEVHLYAMLWTMTIGSKIDRELSDDLFGNRVRDSFREESEASGPSPYLMRPYFEQYETWRDQSLDIVNKEHSMNKSTIMVNLDLKRFYYQVDLTKKIEDRVKNFESNDLKYKDVNFSKELSIFIFEIMKNYTSKIKQFDHNISSNCMLPLGFMPSTILSNYYLEEFDDCIRNSKPLYYGRYVDDILIVYRSSESLQIEEDLNCLVNTKDDQFKEKYSHKITKLLNQLYCLHQNCSYKKWAVKTSNEEHIIQFDLNESKKLDFNIDKVKIFYFDQDYPNQIIDEFKKHIWITKSEFRLLPENILEFDFGKMSKQFQNNGIKISNIFSAKIDKFELSKFVSKHLQIVKGLDISDGDDSLESLIEVLTEPILIEMYILWESIFTLLIMSKKQDLLEVIIVRITNSISNLVYHGKSNLNVRIFQENLSSYLYMSLSGALSVLAIKNMDKIFTNIELKSNQNLLFFLKNYSHKFRITNFTNKSYLNIVPSFLKELNEISFSSDKFELFKLENIIGNIKNYYFEKISSNKRNEEYYQYPYNISVLDIQILKLIKRIQTKNWECSSSEVDFLMEKWLPINGYNSENSSKIFGNKIMVKDIGNCETQVVYEKGDFIDLKIEKRSKINKRIINYLDSEYYESPCIGVGNVRIEEPLNYYDRVRSEKSDKSKERFENLSETINTVIKYRSKKSIQTNLFVLPEAYVPFEWLSLLVNTAKKNNIGIITGLEHIKYDDKYYNFLVSIFPIKMKNFTMVNVNFHLKVHYSPLELKEFEDHVVSGNTYEMHKWRGMNIVPYLCFELTSIKDRSLFKDDDINVVAAIVNNRDVEYFSNIIESMSRDLSCFVVQANDACFGDSRIFQPAREHQKNVLRFSGGINYTALMAKIELEDLKKHLKRPIQLQMDSKIWKARVPK